MSNFKAVMVKEDVFWKIKERALKKKMTISDYMRSLVDNNDEKETWKTSQSTQNT